MNSAGKFVMECVIETKGSMLLRLIDGLRGDVHITFDEGPGRLFLSDTRHDDTGRLVQLADLLVESHLFKQSFGILLCLGAERAGLRVC
jgi:hypothetical protein